jgi:transposase
MSTSLRTLTPEERRTLQRLVRSRTAPIRLVERARIIWAAHQGEPTLVIARQLQLDPRTVASRLSRFNAQGLPALEDRPRSGRPSTYTKEQIGEVIATALTDPSSLGLPFACWTLDRLQAYLNEARGIGIKRSRIDEILLAEGLRWRTQESWFGERVDPAFAEKRGRSSSCTRPHLKAA